MHSPNPSLERARIKCTEEGLPGFNQVVPKYQASCSVNLQKQHPEMGQSASTRFALRRGMLYCSI